jgi:hypothetical protein
MPIDRNPASHTIVRQLSGSAGEERFCIVHEVPLPTGDAFAFSCMGGACGTHGVPVAVACDMLIAAGLSESDAYRLLDEARSYSPRGAPKPRQGS